MYGGKNSDKSGVKRVYILTPSRQFVQNILILKKSPR